MNTAEAKSRERVYGLFIQKHVPTCETCQMGKCHYCKNSDATLLVWTESNIIPVGVCQMCFDTASKSIQLSRK